MAATTTTDEPVSKARGLVILRDYWQLTRPRILGLVLFTLVVAALIAGQEVPGWGLLLHAVCGSALVIVGAIALNQRLEIAGDAKMPRTAKRPLPSGRLSRRSVTWFGLWASALGIAYVWWFVHPGMVAVAVVSWIIYVWVYTPLKIFTPWQTPIGAIAGAMPTLLGATAVQAPMSPAAVTLFGVVFLWQFPHAMAIAWLYRDQFARASSKVATVVDPSGQLAALLSVAGSLALVPVSLLPVFFGQVGWVYGSCTALFGAAYLVPSIRFLLRRDDRRARTLLRVSFAYLPAVFIALLVAYRVG